MNLHYFTYGDDFAAVEDVEQAQRYAAAGWQAATHDQFIAAWRRRDAANAPRPRTQTAPLARTTGSTVVYPVGYHH